MKIDASFKILTATVFVGVFLAFVNTPSAVSPHLNQVNLGGIGNAFSFHQIKDAAKFLFERAAAYAALKS